MRIESGFAHEIKEIARQVIRTAVGMLNLEQKREIVADGIRSSRSVKGGSLFVSFSVPGEVMHCTFRHRYLITPDGTIKQLPVKIVIQRT